MLHFTCLRKIVSAVLLILPPEYNFEEHYVLFPDHLSWIQFEFCHLLLDSPNSHPEHVFFSPSEVHGDESIDKI